MESALIISHSDKGNAALFSVLKGIACNKISTVKTCGDARRLSKEKSFDLYIINSPVNNESGEDLARELIGNEVSQVIFFVKNEALDFMANRLEGHGVILVPKPVNKQLLNISLKLSKAVYFRLKKMQKNTSKLTQKIEDIKIIDRAKYVLISHLRMSEEQAHKHIEKKAMDMRKTKREVAENILKVYEN